MSHLPQEQEPERRAAGSDKIQLVEVHLEGENKVSMTDPIADMLTRIRNASRAKNDRVSMPLSRLKLEVCKVLKEEGYVKNFRVNREETVPLLIISLKYDARGESILSGLVRVSKPGVRIYVSKDRVPRVQSGLGTTILSTSKGIMSGEQARQQGVGGEVLCKVW